MVETGDDKESGTVGADRTIRVRTGQTDYISGSDPLRKQTGAEIIAPQPDFDVARFPYTAVGDGDIFRFDGTGPKVKAIHTPGQTPGSTSYLIDEKYLVAGDAVFILPIGRPDLEGMVEAAF